MLTEKEKLLVYKCLRCLAEWTPRKTNPLRCPRCKSKYWNVPRKSRETNAIVCVK